ncbi:helix-turn-helix transcriptional regulator [Georgenia thermotolerans]|uniref:helix-turn-helix transcriptional regulator n=1 Tax=Georgenia thermotolerans TaxID=527326 RepID=UPI00186AE23D|nr:helix-turn-helix transcriptional regulator [Georgenia thermotolerans]
MSTRRPKVRYLREVWMKVISGERIAKARRRAGYTQYELAALTKCTQAAISGLETGNMPRCSEDLAKAICKWLDRDVEELFERHGDSRVERVTNAAGSTHQRKKVAA